MYFNFTKKTVKMTNVVRFPRKDISSMALEYISDRKPLADTGNNDESIHQSLNESLHQIVQETKRMAELIKLLDAQLKEYGHR